MPNFLHNIWYFAMPAEALRPGGLVHKVLLGEPVVIGRSEAGEVFALKDICPHRGVPLSAGRLLEGDEGG
ncbi:Rieske (2Fe-2S) protein, partial [uncultured Parvibaculum sp.]|uniref:Rieske (2Fe-2S) protein n=1 Tax=uncultured Parvibaculum sp. TaxID=291828 RepID=UPI0030DC3B09